MRWRDGSWLRRPAPERLIKALGEPLVIVQRSALRDILTGALAPETIEYGLSAIKLTRAADGVRVRLSDGNDRTTDAVIGADGTRSVVARHLNGPLADRYVGYTAWRGVATCDGPRVGRRDTWSRRRNRPCADGCGSPVLVRHRARFGRAALAWRRIALSASKIRQLARTDSEDAGSDGPRRGAAQRPLRPHPRPDLGARARRGGRRRGSSDALAPGSGRLPGARGRRGAGRVRRPGGRPAHRVRPVRRVPPAPRPAHRRRIRAVGQGGQPAPGGAERCRNPGHRTGSRSHADPPHRVGGGALGFHPAERLGLLVYRRCAATNRFPGTKSRTSAGAGPARSRPSARPTASRARPSRAGRTTHRRPRVPRSTTARRSWAPPDPDRSVPSGPGSGPSVPGAWHGPAGRGTWAPTPPPRPDCRRR
ncbi:FAD-binding monooxygenase [Mycobacterium avium subsp. paratuberculosis S5]|nr:FAD-binding monooxygenase [Mycobacterium avium subsp. paratuberculosis S5]